MRVSWLTIFFSLLFLVIPLASAQIEDYKYYRTIETDVRDPVWVQLDAAILDNSQSDGNDIRLIQGTSEIPFFIDYTPGLAPVSIVDLSASSTLAPFRGETYVTANMINNAPSYYQNDILEDKNSTTIIISLSQLTRLEKISFTFGDRPNEYTVWVWANGKYQNVGSTGSNELSLNAITSNKIKVEFSHEGTVQINEVKVFGYSFGRLLFQPTSSSTRLYYGKANDVQPEYDTSALFTSSSTPTIYASNQQVNPLYVDKGEGGVLDNCPSVDNPSQLDSDGDGVGDACDNCPFDSNNNQLDSDNDGYGNSCDNCPSMSNSNQLDKDLDGIGWICDDDDGDGVYNPNDNCLACPNRNQQDVDRDGIGDVCEDDDGDSIINCQDYCPTIEDVSNVDSDKDSLGDVCDNCPDVSNRDQKDENQNGIGDVCEDPDADTIVNANDNCPDVANTNQIDWDNDGLGDVCDNCPEVSNRNQNDIDRDGIGDACDQEESRLLENPVIVWSIIIFASIFILGFALTLRPNNKK